jgi:hypothetical protein
MAILYSYPTAQPSINDIVLGAKFTDQYGITTNSFVIHDLINLMQTTTVTYEGTEPLTAEDLDTLYPNAMVGFKVQGIFEDVLTMYEKTIRELWISYAIQIV